MFGMSDESNCKAHVEKPRCTFEDLTYPKHIREKIKELIDEEPHAHALIEEGLHPKRKILLHGPSGCGKTSIAHAIASEFKLELMTAPADVLQSKYVGESEKNIAKVIKQAGEKKCVLLMDEFDAVAGKRQEGHRYANSVVNTLLTSLENGSMEGFLVACTNHLAHLDDALLRRFDLILEIPMPTRKALIQVAEKVLKGRYEIDPEDCLVGADTPATVERNAKDMLRVKIIAQEKIKPRPKKLPPPKEPSNPYGSGFSNHDGRGTNPYERILREAYEDQSIDVSWTGSAVRADRTPPHIREALEREQRQARWRGAGRR